MKSYYYDVLKQDWDRLLDALERSTGTRLAKEHLEKYPMEKPENREVLETVYDELYGNEQTKEGKK